MKKEENIHRFDSLSEAHRMFGLPKPQHPLISFINNTDNQIKVNMFPHSHVLSFYKISYRTKLSGKLKYGQGYYDFDEGGLLFASPNQVVGSTDEHEDHCGCTILIHPDFFWNFPLVKKIKQYGFFSYSVNEALHLSETERSTILSIFKLIEKAKEKIATTSSSISEIAYELGFEHLSSFNRLFKSKTSFSPLEFRRSFN